MVRTRQLAIVRHGQTVASADKALYDVDDPDSLPLTDAGLEEAHELASVLARHIGRRTRAVVCSPSVRCLQTAEIVCSHLFVVGSAPTVIEDLRAQGWGKEQFPGRRELMRSWTYPEGLLDSCFPGGEPGWHARDRAVAALTEIIAVADSYDWTVVVTHGFMLRCMLGELLGWTAEELNASARVSPGKGVFVRLRQSSGVRRPACDGEDVEYVHFKA